jgi:hypothetical protein
MEIDPVDAVPVQNAGEARARLVALAVTILKQAMPSSVSSVMITALAAGCSEGMGPPPRLVGVAGIGAAVRNITGDRSGFRICLSGALIANPPAPPGRDATNVRFQGLNSTQNLAEAAVELVNGHVMGRVGLQQEETNLSLVAGTSFAEPLHEQPHQLGVLG